VKDEPLARFMVMSVLAHSGLGLAVLVGVLLAGLWGPEEYVPRETIEVSMVALPKSARNVPDRAARRKRAAGADQSKVPPPVDRSDLAFHDDQADPDPGNTDAATRQEILDQIERERMLEELNDAPDGPVDRNATDPNGVEGLDIAVLGAGVKGDPDAMRWYAQLQQMLANKFHPIQAITQGRTDLVCIVTVRADPDTGEILDYEITKSSGLLSYDEAAKRVIAEFQKLPLPPERYRPLLTDGVGFRFVPPSP
jgi:TonB C terminal